ncbi:Variant surface glycoprotein [Trypanosoma congolense IL3000]|uniref:Variant surface glycoprotein n=1 Tax=Trypanosoma congolense (strain IL3000) TaxID=1068625 RepID=F9WEM4_TRYCI|nr:Variant surface glycoprotein [Trypanosoma congolense IL3000]
MESRRIGRGILAIVVFMAMVMNGVRGGDFGNYGRGYDFNGAEHNALCGVFRAAVDLWNASRKSDLKLGGGLETSLGQAIFGNTRSKKLETITDALPKEYKNHKISQRGVLCGTCKYGEQPHYPGRSITHDLMCLCTSGKYGEPFYSYFWNYFFFRYSFSTTSYTLCGKKREQLVKDENEGWYEEGRHKQATGLDKSWKNVVWGCLSSSKREEGIESHDLKEKVSRLMETMRNFTTVLKVVDGRHRLGGVHGHNSKGDGKDEKSMHVHYDTCDIIRKPWWKRLNETLNGKDPEALLVDRSTPTPSVEGMEDTDGESEFFGEEQNTESEGPTPLAGSPLQSNNGTQIQGPTNSTESTVIPLNTSASGNSTYPRLEYLRSHAVKNLPCSWFLGASFFI